MLIPFVIWSLFYSAVSIFINLLKGEDINLLWYLYRFIIGKASTPFYYIVVLIQLTLLTPGLIWVIDRKKIMSRLLWLVTPAYLILVYYWHLNDCAPELLGTLFPAWFFFYYLGLQVKMDWKKWNSLSVKFGHWYLPLILICLSITEAFMLLNIGCSSDFAISQVKVSSFIYVFALIMFLLKANSIYKAKPKRGLIKAMKIVGDYSFGIFFIHCFILMFVTKALRIVGIDSIWILYFLLTWVILSAMSFAVVMVVNKVLGSSAGGKKILGWIGFK